MYKKIQKRVFEIIEKGKKNDKSSIIFDSFIMTLITLNVASVFIETFNISSNFAYTLKIFEIVSILFLLFNIYLDCGQLLIYFLNVLI